MNDVTVVYDNGIRAVNKASLRVDEGEFVFLVGASGSGKTTIIKLLTAEVRPTEGKMLVNNYNIGEMKKSRIPYGETRSYKQLAEAIGQPNACRAVGMANHANPILIAVPCHRVICADGSPGGYAGGAEMKKALLRLEQAGRA